jgi:putative FmdB family regulatory protein
MPTYEYRCPDGHEFERFYRKISDATPDVSCPVCGKPAERKLSAGAGLVFKGSGFYLTDYGKNAHRAAPSGASGEGGGTEKEGGKEPATGESKSEGAKSADAKGGSASEAKASGDSTTKSAPAKTDTKPASDSAPKKPGSSKGDG